MEKLQQRIGRLLVAWTLCLVAWLVLLQGVDHDEDLLAMGLVALVLVAAGVGIFFLDRRIVHGGERAAHARRQLDVLQLAAAEGGQLTATQTAAQLGWPLGVALTTLLSLEDGVRVTAVVPESGVRVFEFPEIIYGAAPRDGESAVPGSALPSPVRD